MAKGAKTTAQKLFDAIADRIVNKLVTNDTLTTKLADYLLKSAMSSTNINSTTNVPTSALVYSLLQDVNNNLSNANSQITQLYSDMSNQLKNMHQTVRHPTNITTGTNILKLGPGFYVYEDMNSSDQDKLNMGFPAPIWHSHIHVLGSLNNSDDTGYISIIIEDMNDANGSKIYYRLHAWSEWRPWRMISTTEVSTSST